MSTRWESVGGEITATLRESREARLRRARAALAQVLERINEQPPLRRATAPTVRRHTPVTAAPTLPNRARAWERGRRDLEAWLQSTVARAPARYVAPPPKTPPPPVLPWQSPEPRFAPLPTSWSPTPVVGFRAWRITKDGVEGAVKTWNEPTYHAVCEKYGRVPMGGDVPHTEGECYDPPCGIYALKEPAPIVRRAHGSWWAHGMVELSGKVVEHTIGYRAAQATVVAITVTVGGTLYMFEEPDSIARLFVGGRKALGVADRVATIGVAGPAPDVTAYLEEVRLLHAAVGGAVGR